MLTDSIGDCFSRLRNAARARKELVTVPHSKLKEQILNLLKKQGFLSEVTTENSKEGKKDLVVRIKYHSGQISVLESIRRTSRPGQRVYSKVPSGKGVRQGLGFQILSTPKGILTDRQAAEHKVGGEIMGEVW